ncbi:MAG: hypothetical protein K2O03_10005 [Lachnospiraceae bacterium]|nr:hypothetical protein [Lachnospiraceae bacterium]
MPQVGAGRILNEMCSSRICVDGYGNGEMQGRLYNNYYEEPIVFSNIMQLLKKMESMFDGFEYPQRTFRARNFFGVEKKPEKLPDRSAQMQLKPQDECGTVATFYVKVIFRKNASWQGNVQWVNGGQNENFRSIFELLMLMDGVMAGQGTEGKM